MRATLLAGLLVLAATVAAAQETDKPALTTEHHFRYEIGVEKTRTVAGWFEETDGKVRVVALDLDGDGKFEKKKLTVVDQPQGAGISEFIEITFEVPHEGRQWGFQYFDMFQFLPKEQQVPADRFHLTWTVTRDLSTVIFRGASATFHATAEAAAKADAVRIGGGFSFEVTAGTQGPKALVNIGVKDAAGCSLSHMMKGGKVLSPTFTLSQGGEVKLSETAPFG